MFSRASPHRRHDPVGAGLDAEVDATPRRLDVLLAGGVESHHRDREHPAEAVLACILAAAGHTWTSAP
jgi:hypothetical protein